MNNWTMIGADDDGDIEIRSSLNGDGLEPSETAQVDQQTAELEHLLTKLITLHVSMIVSRHLEQAEWSRETVKRITALALSLNQAQALSLVNTLGSQIAGHLVDQNGGPEKMWERFESGENPIDLHDGACDSPTCPHRVQEMFESDG